MRHTPLQNLWQKNLFATVAAPLLAMLLIVDIVLGLYGFYVEIGLLSFRTMFVPCVEALAVILLLYVFLRGITAQFLGVSTVAKIYFALLCVVIAVLPIALDRWHKNTVAKVNLEIPGAVVTGKSTRITNVRYAQSTSKSSLVGAQCNLGDEMFANWFASGYAMKCGSTRYLVDVTYLWSTASILIRLDT